MLFTRRDLIKLLGPLIVEQILAVLVGMVDVIMVAAVGEAAVSGVALVDSISILIIQVLAALATGGAVVVSQYLGMKQSENACKAAGQLLLSSLIFAVFISILALTWNSHLLRIIFGNTDSTVMENARIYFFLSALSYPFLAVYNSCAALYRSMGNSRVSMVASIIMNTINIAGNAICIYGLKMGVEGVGIPTLISRAAAAFLMVYLIQNPDNIVRIKNLKELRIEKSIIKKILAVGVPNGLENGMFQCGKLMLQSLVSSLGTASIASFAVASNLATIQYLPGNAIGLGLITIVGQCVGAGEYKQAKEYTKKLIFLNYIMAAVVCILMAAGSRQLIGLYNLSPEASDIARRMITAHAAAMIIWPLAFTVTNALRAGYQARFTMVISIVSMWTFRIGFGYLFVKAADMGIMGIWYAMFIDWAFRAIVFMWKFRNYLERS